jgi:hypothetical protein
MFSKLNLRGVNIVKAKCVWYYNVAVGGVHFNENMLPFLLGG